MADQFQKMPITSFGMCFVNTVVSRSYCKVIVSLWKLTTVYKPIRSVHLTIDV